MTYGSDVATIRVLSIVEARSVTGPVKPLLMFSPLAQAGSAGHARIVHTMLTTRRAADVHDDLRSAALQAGLDYRVVQERGTFDMRVLSGMREQIRRCAPQIVETHDCKSHFIMFVLRLLDSDIRRSKWIAFHHGYTRTSWKVAAYQQLDRLTLRAADQIMTLCQPFAAMLARRGAPAHKIKVISNTIAPQPAPPEADVKEFRHRLGISDAECVISSVGRLSGEKGHADLIAAFTRLAGRVEDPAVRLLIVGDGPEREKLQQLALPLGQRIIFAGHLQDPSIAFHASDIFALPSHSEGSPLVILEAMAASLPIVATAVGGVPETVANQRTALLVRAGDREALAAALEQLVRDPALGRRLGVAAAEALEKLSPEAYCERLLSIYEQVLLKKAAVSTFAGHSK